MRNASFRSRGLQVAVVVVAGVALPLCSAGALSPVSAPNATHCATTANGGDNDVHLTVTGAQAVPTTLKISTSHVTRDQAGATWTDTRVGGADKVSRNAITVKGSGQFNCLSHGLIFYDDNSTNWNDWHYRSGLKVYQPNLVADQMVIRNEGDSVEVNSSSSAVGTNFRLSRSWLDGSHDDCFQNDAYLDGVVLQGNLMQCYVAFSSRQTGTALDGSHRVEILDANIVVLQPTASVYKVTSPGTGGWFKWDDNSAVALRLALWNNTFVASQLPNHTGLGLNGQIAAPDDCFGNVIDWLGPVGGFPASALASWNTKCPGGFTFLEGQAALDDSTSKIASWHANNPSVG